MLYLCVEESWRVDLCVVLIKHFWCYDIEDVVSRTSNLCRCSMFVVLCFTQISIEFRENQNLVKMMKVPKVFRFLNEKGNILGISLEFSHQTLEV